MKTCGRPRRLVALSNTILPVRLRCPFTFSAANLHGSLLLIHGTKDTDVPYALSVQMDKELTAKGVPHQFITIPDGIHGFRSKADAEVAARTYQQVVEFLDKNREAR